MYWTIDYGYALTTELTSSLEKNEKIRAALSIDKQFQFLCLICFFASSTSLKQNTKEHKEKIFFFQQEYLNCMDVFLRRFLIEKEIFQYHESFEPQSLRPAQIPNIYVFAIQSCVAYGSHSYVVFGCFIRVFVLFFFAKLIFFRLHKRSLALFCNANE